VISSRTADIIPKNIQLPLTEESTAVSFQVDSLETLTLDFDIYPTFGSKVIAKSTALSDLFSTRIKDYNLEGSETCLLPLFDPRLRTIGRLSFNIQVIKPFQGIPLEITHFATYWKATSGFDSHANALITGSSLSGQYVRVYVQLTSDG